MKIVIASDSFKGSLSGQTINSIWNKIVEKDKNNYDIIPLLVADGGDGTLDAVIKQKNGKIIMAKVRDPLFNTINSRYGVFNESAVISMCECSGLTLVPTNKRNPLKTTSYGTGELIKQAVLSGKKKIYITLGGSATNDGGMGALTALGYKFIKKDGSVAKGIGEELIDIASIDNSRAINTSDVEFIILSDVTNPLIGKKGAAHTFAKQKGADKNDIQLLESGMNNFANVLNDKYNIDVNAISGGGAAGGMGASLSVMLNAKIVSGIEEILKIVDFDDKIKDADYIITGEGKIDRQSKDGKVVSGVLKHAKDLNKPVIAIVGTIGEGFDELYDYGLTSVFSIIDKPASPDNILSESEELYEKAAFNVLRLISAKK